MKGGKVTSVGGILAIDLPDLEVALSHNCEFFVGICIVLAMPTPGCITCLHIGNKWEEMDDNIIVVKYVLFNNPFPLGSLLVKVVGIEYYHLPMQCVLQPGPPTLQSGLPLIPIPGLPGHSI